MLTMLAASYPAYGLVRSADDSAARLSRTASAVENSWLGTYRGKFEGADGEIEIAPAGSDRLAIRIIVGAPECSGSIDFEAPVPTADRLVLTSTDEMTEGLCTITLARRGRTIRSLEEGCAASHGRLCTFTGKAKRRD
ncbi:hypothetical protein C7I55_09025 [Sphingomonas deserti]|uniref:Uncharacterized protein n=1 Tax=Allosphingosinicella deserti TaxID=2116704 RepID=A0A2P7QRA1_9SPHN|nr:hypothetical protein C7I55_09025 [Sphingomonas deserti]